MPPQIKATYESYSLRDGIGRWGSGDIARWARAMSTPSRPVTPYFIQLSFRDIDHATTRNFFNRIPTSFSLTDEQVDKLIAAGRELLRSNPDSQRFVAGLNGRRTTRR